MDCFVRHAWFALSVSLVMENSCLKQFFKVIQLSWDNLIADYLVIFFFCSWLLDYFVRHPWFALSVFSGDGKFLLKAVS